MERDRLLTELALLGGLPGWQIELCGFGVVAAAALATRWLHVHQPEQVVLAGIAGSLDTSLTIGSACWFSDVACDDIGVQRTDSNDFVSASELGWNQVDSEVSGSPIGDRLSLASPGDRSNGLLTVCAASGNRETAAQRRARFDFTPIAEDMEGFAVALACQIQAVPLAIVRGISNLAGDRDHKQWDIDGCLRNVAIELVSYGRSRPN